MSEHHRLPWLEVRPPEGSDCTAWSPGGLEDLSRVRREFRSWVSAAAQDSPRLRENRVEEGVLALDELMSNALRHGRAPIEVLVCGTDGGVLLQVADRDPDTPPRPTSTRDPGQGGMGLGMIADFALDCGWYPFEDQKVVWAVMPSADS